MLHLLLGDEGPLAGALLPQEAEDESVGGGEEPDHGRRGPRQTLQRAGDRQRDRHRMAQGQRLRHQLPQDQRGVGDAHDDDAQGDGLRKRGQERQRDVRRSWARGRGRPRRRPRPRPGCRRRSRRPAPWPGSGPGRPGWRPRAGRGHRRPWRAAVSGSGGPR
ncbi:MAG: hypothetical protein M0C28_11740 [Candidatus Moduliflexus flocculans]|nr:hypothetical protein [Candidatus Moduliflexus flocculans]